MSLGGWGGHRHGQRGAVGGAASRHASAGVAKRSALVPASVARGGRAGRAGAGAPATARGDARKRGLASASVADGRAVAVPAAARGGRAAGLAPAAAWRVPRKGEALLPASSLQRVAAQGSIASRGVERAPQAMAARRAAGVPEAAPPEAQEPRPQQRRGGRRSFATHAQARAHKADAAIREMLAELPASVPRLVLGAGALRQVPDAAAREDLLLAHFRKRSGPEGESARKALRAWRALGVTAAARGLPRHGLPASAALVADVSRAQLKRARAEAKGSQGGMTVGKTFRQGFMYLENVAMLPIDASGALVDEAVQPEATDEPRPTNHAGTLPIAAQCAFEVVAAEAVWSVRRTVARAFLCTAFAHHIRFCDALNTRLWRDEQMPACVIRGSTQVRGKTALPIQLYAPAEGFLGEWAWLDEHMAEMAGRGHALPAFEHAAG